MRHEVNGLLVPPGDATALATAIRKLVDSPELRRQYGAAGRQIVEQEFSEAIVVGQTLALYRTMLGGRWPQNGQRVPGDRGPDQDKAAQSKF